MPGQHARAGHRQPNADQAVPANKGRSGERGRHNPFGESVGRAGGKAHMSGRHASGLPPWNCQASMKRAVEFWQAGLVWGFGFEHRRCKATAGSAGWAQHCRLWGGRAQLRQLASRRMLGGLHQVPLKPGWAQARRPQRAQQPQRAQRPRRAHEPQRALPPQWASRPGPRGRPRRARQPRRRQGRPRRW